MQKEEQIVLDKRKSKALQTSIKEGSSSSIFSSILETHITPLALALKASAMQVGTMSAISGLIAPLAQFIGSRMMSQEGRKKIVIRFALLQALLLLPIASLSIILWKGSFQDYLIYTLIILYALVAAAGGVIYPAWFSWMGDLVPKESRGAYFSKRNRIT